MGITIFCREFFVSQCRKNAQGNLSLFNRISGIEKIHGEEGWGGGNHDLPSNTFCLTVPKNFFMEPVVVSQNFLSRKMSGIREGVIHFFPSKTFLSHSAEKSHKGTLL